MRIRLMLMIALLMIAGAAHAAFKPNGMVILLTDYGADSVYVGAIKGSIYDKFPAARVDSITNSVPNFDVMAGAYLLAEGCLSFPTGTVFCCIVDPGVGTQRKGLVIETKAGNVFVGPDNGLMSVVARNQGIVSLRECSNEALWRKSEINNTFHGRDIFGPVAAAVAGGAALESVGPALETLVKLDVKLPTAADGVVSGEIIRVDGYGNMVSNVPQAMLVEAGLKEGDRMEVTLGKGKYVCPWVSTYGKVAEGERLVCIQSSGLVECAANMKSLSEITGEGLHASVSFTKAK